MSPDIIEMLDQARPMVRNFAYNYELEFDDLMQEAALVVIETLPKIPAGAHPYAYLQRAIKYHLINLLRGRHQALSLDEPITEEADTTYADLLASPTPAAPEELQTVDQRQDALYTALRTLPLEEQMYLREVYALNAYNPVLPEGQRKVNYDRSRQARGKHAFRQLRADIALLTSITTQPLHATL